MVSEVSAIEVASTTLRPRSAGAMAARWAAKGLAPTRGRIAQSPGSRPANSRSTRRISPSPGKNTSSPPPLWRVSASARSTSAAAASARRALGPRGRSSHRVSTGKLRPSEVRTGAPISSATGPASSVADIASRIRSSRSAPATSRHSASPRSAFSDRSWNSSKITAPIPGRSGADCSIRVRMPSVTTSIRVCFDTFAAPRMR